MELQVFLMNSGPSNVAVFSNVHELGRRNNACLCGHQAVELDRIQLIVSLSKSGNSSGSESFGPFECTKAL